MQYTPNYNFKLPEGTDIVNPLVDTNPNWSSLDATLRTFATRTISPASEVVTGTLHRVTRDSNIYSCFSFNATADFKPGDTFQLENLNIPILLEDGTPITDITDVLYKTGTRVMGFYAAGIAITLFVSTAKSMTASEVTTDGGDSVQDYIDNTKFKNLETWTPNIGENWETFLARIRDNSTKTIPANFIRCTVDGVSGLIFRQSRRTSATSWQYETDYFTGNSLIKYAMSVGSDSAVLRKYDILNGTVQNLSSADAQTINIYGLDV